MRRLFRRATQKAERRELRAESEAVPDTNNSRGDGDKEHAKEIGAPGAAKRRGRRASAADGRSLGRKLAAAFFCKGKLPRSPSPTGAADDLFQSLERDSPVGPQATGPQRHRCSPFARSRSPVGVQPADVGTTALGSEAVVGRHSGKALGSTSSTNVSTRALSDSLGSVPAMVPTPASASSSALVSMASWLETTGGQKAAEERSSQQKPASQRSSGLVPARVAASAAAADEAITPRRRIVLEELERHRMLLEDHLATAARAHDRVHGHGADVALPARCVASPPQDSLAAPSPCDVPSPGVLSCLDERTASPASRPWAESGQPPKYPKGLAFRQAQLQDSPSLWHPRGRSPMGVCPTSFASPFSGGSSSSGAGRSRLGSKSMSCLVQEEHLSRAKAAADAAEALAGLATPAVSYTASMSTRASPIRPMSAASTSPFRDSWSNASHSPRGSHLQEAQLLLADMFTPSDQPPSRGTLGQCSPSPMRSPAWSSASSTVCARKAMPRRLSEPAIRNSDLGVLVEAVTELKGTSVRHSHSGLCRRGALQPLNGCMPHFPAADPSSPSDTARSQSSCTRRSQRRLLSSPALRSPAGTFSAGAVLETPDHGEESAVRLGEIAEQPGALVAASTPTPSRRPEFNARACTARSGKPSPSTARCGLPPLPPSSTSPAPVTSQFSWCSASLVGRSDRQDAMPQTPNGTDDFPSQGTDVDPTHNPADESSVAASTTSRSVKTARKKRVTVRKLSVASGGRRSSKVAQPTDVGVSVAAPSRAGGSRRGSECSVGSSSGVPVCLDEVEPRIFEHGDADVRGLRCARIRDDWPGSSCTSSPLVLGFDSPAGMPPTPPLRAAAADSDGVIPPLPMESASVTAPPVPPLPASPFVVAPPAGLKPSAAAVADPEPAQAPEMDTEQGKSKKASAVVPRARIKRRSRSSQEAVAERPIPEDSGSRDEEDSRV